MQFGEGLVLRRIADRPINRIAELPPWHVLSVKSPATEAYDTNDCLNRIVPTSLIVAQFGLTRQAWIAAAEIEAACCHCLR